MVIITRPKTEKGNGSVSGTEVPTSMLYSEEELSYSVGRDWNGGSRPGEYPCVKGTAIRLSRSCHGCSVFVHSLTNVLYSTGAPLNRFYRIS